MTDIERAMYQMVLDRLTVLLDLNIDYPQPARAEAERVRRELKSLLDS